MKTLGTYVIALAMLASSYAVGAVFGYQYGVESHVHPVEQECDPLGGSGGFGPAQTR